MARTRPLQPTEVELPMRKIPLRAERKKCGEDLAVATLGNRVEYGREFLAIEEMRGRSTVLAVGDSRGSLLARICRIVGAPSNTGVSSPRPTFSLFVGCIAVACIFGIFSWTGLAQSPDGSSVDVQNSGEVNTERIDDSFEISSGEWPMWGGSPHRNHVASGRMPSDWDLKTGRNVLWKTPLGTQTYASPVVSGGKIFIGTNNGAARDPIRAKKQDLSCLVCLDQTTGKVLWRYASEKLPTGRVHDWPEIGLCSTACVVGDRLWVVTNRCEVLCLDTEGFRDGENDGSIINETNRTEIDADVVWTFDMFNALGVRPLHQAVSSIAVVDGLVLLNTSNSSNESRDSVPAPNAPNFLALDASTGRVVWQDNSAGESILVGGSSCGCPGTSPAVATIGGVTQAIFAGREGWLYGFDFADLKQGKTTRLWNFDCNPKASKYTKGGGSTRNTLVASPVVVGNYVFVATGRDPEQGEGAGDLWCIDATKRGDISSELVFNNSHLGGREPIPHKPLCACDPKQGDFTRPNPNSGAIWHYAGSDRDGDGKFSFEESFHRSLGSPAIHDGLLFIADFSGLMHCIDARTGDALWVDDLLATVWSSCVIADGKVLIGDEDGNLTIYRAARTRQRVHGDDAPSFGASIYSTPAVANDSLFVATKDTLVAIREGQVNATSSISVRSEPNGQNVTPVLPAPPEQNELDVLHEKFKRVLPRDWTVHRQDRAFEFRGPNGPTEATKSEQAQMTLWFSDLFYDSRTLQQRDPKLTRILSWGRTRLGQVLSTRNQAAIENWPEFGDVLYWLLPNEHVAIIGDVDLYQKIDGQNSLISLIYTSGSVIDLRIEDVLNDMLLLADGRGIMTGRSTKYARLSDDGEVRAERTDLKFRVRVRYEVVPGVGATKVIILSAPNDGEQETTVPSDAQKAVAPPANTDRGESEWGDDLNGLRARVVPVLSLMSEDAIDPSQRVAKFENPDDVAFAVELENVSDKPMTLLDTRYGSSFGASSGKAHSDWYGQFMFSIDLFDPEGKLIERPEVEVVTLDSVLGSVGVATVEPGKTHRFLLRPSKWLSVFQRNFEPGNHRVAVRYHGMPPRVVTRIKEYKAESPVFSAVAGDIVTPPVAFEVRSLLVASDSSNETDQAAKKQTELVWGEPTNGVRAALSFAPQKASHAHGEKPELNMTVENVSDKPITLASQLWMSDLAAQVKNEKGEPVQVGGTFYSGSTPVVRVTLKPGQIAVFGAGNIGLAINGERAGKFADITNRTLVAPEGKYTVQLAERFGTSFKMKDGKGKVLAPLPDDFVGIVETGEAQLTITNETIECNIIDAVTGQPVAGTTVNFRFIKPRMSIDNPKRLLPMFTG